MKMLTVIIDSILTDEDVDGDGNLDTVDEDLDGDGRLDDGTEDVDGDGVLDTRDMITMDVDAEDGDPAILNVLATDLEINGDSVATDDDVEANTALIESNDTDIATNATNIASNDTDIATNAENIASNDADIAANATNRSRTT